MKRTVLCLSDAFHLSFSMTKNRKNTNRLFFKNLTKAPFPIVQNKSERDVCTLCDSLPPLTQRKTPPPPLFLNNQTSTGLWYMVNMIMSGEQSNLSVESPKPQMDKPVTVVPSLPPQHTNLETRILARIFTERCHRMPKPLGGHVSAGH